ncbi:MAG: arginase family hydrolase [bacterium P3]|nr:MAG: arginase family hydrolase [bacterium P3]KWW41087.1 MAG: arginase family hydrolase [bacterium F083]
MKQYFEPIELSSLHLDPEKGMDYLSNHIDAYFDGGGFPDLQQSRLVMFAVPEDRAAVHNKGCAEAARHVRAKLYALASPADDVHVADLGNLIPGTTLSDTYTALAHVASELLAQGKTIVVLGGSQDLTFALYQAYARQSHIINIAAVDSRFDLGDGDDITSRNYMKHIIMQKPNYLFHFTNVGFQTYFVGPHYVELMNELHFQSYRLGAVQGDMVTAEPVMRNADMVSVDMSAVRQSDAPAHGDTSPHGFYGEQLCQIFRFAGMSDKTSSLLLSELNPFYDRDEQSAHLAAHALWYFIEGFYGRKSDFPYRDKQNYKRYSVHVRDFDTPILFYKSKKSDRWWMEVPCEDAERREHYGPHLLIPCVYADYERAMQNELPDTWMLYYHWINDEMG